MDTQRRKPGRPKKPLGTKKQQASVYLTPEVIERLGRYSDNLSEAIELVALRADPELLTGALILGALFATGSDRPGVTAAADDLLAFKVSKKTLTAMRQAVDAKKDLNLMEILFLS